MAEGDTWEEVLATYERPYARWMPIAYKTQRVRELLAAAAALGVVAAVLDVVRDDGAPAGLIPVTAVVGTLVLVWTAYITLVAASAIRERTADWRAHETSELARVRSQRPHAGEGDGVYASVQYAVTVGAAGELITWELRPLAADEWPAPADILLRGTPRYAASAVDRVPFDPRDTARAAEQLVEAQSQAATWEVEAEAHAAKVRAGLEAATELAVESASTGAALRRLTGQSPR